MPVPRALRVVGVRTYPIVVLLVIWFIVAGVIDKGGYHNVRLTPSAEAARPVTLEQVFNCWLGKNGLAPSNATTASDVASNKRCGSARQLVSTQAPRAVPLILVATTGGGIRAAYWTDLVLNCAFESAAPPNRCDGRATEAGFDTSNRIFAASGISGGSLGLASYAAYLKLKERTLEPQPNWVPDHLGNDPLSASGAWWLLVELPRVFLQFRGLDDRAAILERGWESTWKGAELSGGLFDLWRNHPHAPLLLLNGTSVADGCRFETSVLDGSVRSAAKDALPQGCRSSESFDNRQPTDPNPAAPLPLDQTSLATTSVLPATRSLSDYLCQQNVDVRLSTAALLSARFPFVNPSARVVWRCPPPHKPTPVAYVVDGGYLDTSGASPIEEMMVKLGPMIDDWNRRHQATPGAGSSTGRAATCIVPLMIQIDNGFSAGASSPPRRPAELLVPPDTLSATRGAREAESRIGAGLDFTQPVAYSNAVNRYARFVNQAHPGPHAPLGWTESQASQDELAGQLTQDANVNALTLVREWLTAGRLKCTPAPRAGRR